MFRGGGVMSHGDVVLVGSRFWEVERPRACAGGVLRCAGGGLGVCVEVFFSFEWVRCVDRGWREVHPGPSRWCGMARGGGGGIPGRPCGSWRRGDGRGAWTVSFEWVGWMTRLSRECGVGLEGSWGLMWECVEALGWVGVTWVVGMWGV